MLIEYIIYLTRDYAIDINREIFRLLYDQEKIVGLFYIDLYEKIKEKRGALAHGTLSSRLKQLKYEDLVTLYGKKYHLTDRARFLYRLNILDFHRSSKTFIEPIDSEIEVRLKRQLILSYHAKNSIGHRYTLQTEKEFSDFLDKYHLRLSDLHFSENKIEKGRTTTYVKECIGDPVHKIRIQIRKQHTNGKVERTSYQYFLPGFNVMELLEGKYMDQLHYFLLAESDMRAEIDLWLEAGLLEKIGMYDNETRYRIRDPIFQIRLRECWDLFDDIFNVLVGIWVYKRNPKDEEKKWFEFFIGSDDEWFANIRHDRHKYSRRQGPIEEIRKEMPALHQRFEELSDSLLMRIKEYDYIIHRFLEYIYPRFMRHSFSNAIIV